LDHFHLPGDSVTNRETWAEWHYFNVVSEGGKRWAFISFIVGGDVTSSNWGGKLGITLREQNGRTRRFGLVLDRSQVHFSTTNANLVFGDSYVSVMADGDYTVRASAPAEDGSRGKISIALRVHPASMAYFPGVALESSGGGVPGRCARISGGLSSQPDLV